MKSLSVRPLILCVQVVISTFPQARNRSGWCPCSSASSPTRFTNLRASRKSGNLKLFVMWCSSMTLQPSTCFSRAASSSPLSGGTPPRQGTHVLAASSDIVERILPPAGERVSPPPSRPSELFGMREERVPREIELIRVHLEDCRRVYSWMLRVSRANSAYVSLGSPRHTRRAGSGGCHLPGHRNVAGPPALSTPWAPRASQRETDAHPRNRRRHTGRGLRIGHGRVVLELDTRAAAGGAVRLRGELRPRRTWMERFCKRAAHGSADRAGTTHAAGRCKCARTIRSRWALVRWICEPGVRTHVSQ